MKLFQLAYLLLLFFLLLTATPPALAIYAKKGCSDRCGNVFIPYPFGIGAGCAINSWYMVDCKNLTPYLSVLNNHLKVLRVDLEDQTVTVSMPSIFYCQKPFVNSSHTVSIDLGRSPFLFSKSHNNFVFEGCGVAIMRMDNGSVVTGCSTACVNVTLGDRNNCFGNGCCHTKIPHYLKSYSINITGLEEEDGGCTGSAFLVARSSPYEEGRFSDELAFKNRSVMPISLLWTLTDSDQVTCCDYFDLERVKVDLFSGTPLDTWKCNDYYSSSPKKNPYLIDGCKDDHAIPRYAKSGCNDKCGNVRIPYPFGIGADCSVNKWYIVDCKSSKPYLPALNHLELLGVEGQLLNVSTPKISDCRDPVRNSSDIIGVDLRSSPFWFSENNIFVFEGCGTATMHMDNGSVLTACSTTCPSVTLSDRNTCFGIRCCHTSIPNSLKSFSINITGLDEEDGACGSAFLVEDKSSYEERRFSDPFIVTNSSFVPISLMWTLTASDPVTCCSNISPKRKVMDMLNGTTVDTWYCYSGSSDGSAYLIDGCVESDHGDHTEECKRCEDSGGYCLHDGIYDVDGSVFSQTFTCHHYNRTSLGVILGVSITMGVLFLVVISYILYKVIKKTKIRRQKKRFFKRNGGLLLKQQEEADPSLVDKTIHFTSRELEKATDNFNENRILGRGGQGTVYKGMLVDGRIVAVKKSKIVDESQLEQFINEVVVLSQINHRNVVKLLGCCLETDVPLLVSEFIPNGTLYDRLHSESASEFSISLDMRLQIATEVAGALAYLHSATSIPIYHRDIKSTNILLDDKYRAKISDFGTSKFVSIDQTHLTTLVKGTFGYLDPEYFQSSQFTEKSDVYSFGVVLVELLTGERPISLTRFGENKSLATHFMLAMEEGRAMSIFDATVIKEGTRDELLIVANLAMRCLNMNGKYRPTMKEVAIELETIRMSHIPSAIQTNVAPMVYGEELSILAYGESSSTFVSFNDNTSQ
ncbi:putative protein kinase RLK-Pelle-WAK family [Helianthus annuus]|nr:putative protein kinase RLK-Pelle-WAK family [Helianthus annuus]KAJ0853474.1 putative protein kinase RLK-Pelle-WAK family [Helianthus annuus]